MQVTLELVAILDQQDRRALKASKDQVVNYRLREYSLVVSLPSMVKVSNNCSSNNIEEILNKHPQKSCKL